MFPRKGCIAIGSDADLVLFDPNKQHIISSATHHRSVDYSAYEGWKLQGKCETTILRGKIAVDKGEVKINKGYGKFIRRNKVSGII